LLPEVSPPNGEGQMLSKCANPQCSASFRYLHEGKLFRMAVASNSAEHSNFGADPGIKKGTSRIEFFWLCEECAPEMTLTFKPGVGVTTQPAARTQVAAAS
jgi:hypothetical protein